MEAKLIKHGKGLDGCHQYELIVGSEPNIFRSYIWAKKEYVNNGHIILYNASPTKNYAASIYATLEIAKF